MAIVNISEADYEVLVSACLGARERGDETEAVALNKICRKADRALTGNSEGVQLAKFLGARGGRQRGNGPLDFAALKSTSAQEGGE